MQIIQRDFFPEELRATYQENSVDGCIAVQSDLNEEDNDFLLNLAKEHQFIKGIAGWVNFLLPNIEERLEYYSDIELMKGFRYIIQAEPDPNFVLRKEFTQGISLLSRYGFSYEILVYPHQLGAALEFVKKFPHQKFVINHMAKPYIKDGFFEGWACLMKAIGKCENVSCKVSGMVTEADFNNWSYEQIKPYIAQVYESFGSKRVMFGSDWPVCLVGGTYKEIKSLPQRFIEKLSPQEQQDFWGGNAVDFYEL